MSTETITKLSSPNNLFIFICIFTIILLIHIVTCWILYITLRNSVGPKGKDALPKS